MRISQCMGFSIVMLLMALNGASLFAQGKVAASVNRIEAREQKTPVFSEAQRGGQGGGGRWCRIDVEIETKGRQWFNELEVRWLVAVNADNLQKTASLPLNVTYTDVKEGKVYACTYISPKFFERYMKSKRADISRISVFVEVYANGQRIARRERRFNNKMPDNWYNMTDKMQAFPTALLPKYKTPFAFLDYDYYEVEKQQ